jgi:hypothetical protein
VSFLHGVRDTVVRDKGRTKLCQDPERTHFREETSGEPEGINGIRIQGLKELLLLGCKGNINKTFREILGLENAKKKKKPDLPSGFEK